MIFGISMPKHQIILKKVSVHNLKRIDLTLNTNELIVFTGVSGSGKSSLAFDTIYVEGQRRYIESLSTFARRYLGDLAKPDAELISGLSPTISIEQKTAGKNPRSTVGTMTEIYDYLRVLYARIAEPHCPISGERVTPQSKEKIIKTIQTFETGTKIVILAPYAKGKKGEFKEDFQFLLKKGFMRAKVDNQIIDLSEEISLDKNVTHDVDIVVDRLIVHPENQSRIAEAVMTALEIGKGVLKVFNLTTEEETLFSMHAFSPKSGIYYSALEPQDFSFNSPSGMCETCHGLGKKEEFDLEKIIEREKSIAEDCCLIASSYQTVRYRNIYNNLASIYGFDIATPWKDLSVDAKNIFLYGTKKKWTEIHFVHPTRGITWHEYIQWRGVIKEAEQRYHEAKSESYKKKYQKLMRIQVCPDCQGSRLKPYPRSALLQGKRIPELAHLTIKEAQAFISSLALTETETLIAQELVKEIIERLRFLIDVGLDYLTLDRSAPTLSGGEAQRVRLASQVGSGLVGVTYVLDEPSIGLHPRDNQRLLKTLKRLREIGNTVIVVEHDEETILAADRIVDFGPGPGVHGGQILINGTLKDLLASKTSLTGAYLSGKKRIPIPEFRKAPGKEELTILGARHNNLKNIDVHFPLNLFIAVTGVSGSGKSSLISDTLYPALANHLHRAEHYVGEHKKIEGLEAIQKVIAIDQSPIGRNPRSNPATYVKIFDEVRALFAKLPESQAKGFQAGRFSFNVSDGSCPECHGMGMLRIDMDFLEDQWVPCTSCRAKRFDHETLQILYKGKSIYDVLEMSVEEALDFFANIPSLKHKLSILSRVGMGYIKLGQPSPTLSGGEAQRIKLAKELVRPSSSKTIYILDEPTTGLHFFDIDALLQVLKNLVDRGNTVIVIEHNMDVIKTVDWIIDLGPEGGQNGGEIVAAGPPEEIAKIDSPTGRALAHAIKLTLSPLSLDSVKKKKQRVGKEVENIVVLGAEQNNLKHLNLNIPRGQMTICTGPSGSGKSSLAFDTIYAEGQRRYIESLSPYARQFVHQMPKPKLTQIEGLSPAIAIEQKAAAGNPRSTVGTMTEAYDYLRILFARAGVAYSPETGEVIESITKNYVVEKILQLKEGEKIMLLAPITLAKNEKFEDLIKKFARLGYLRIRLNGEIYELDAPIFFDRRKKNEIALVIDRIKVSKKEESRLYEGVEKAAQISEGKIIVVHEKGELFFNLAFADASTGKSYKEITPHTFSFNSQEGMCPDCLGLGTQYGSSLTENPEIMQLSFADLLHIFWPIPYARKEPHPLLAAFKKVLAAKKIDPHLSLNELPPEELQFLFGGSNEEEWVEVTKTFRMRWLGIGPTLAKLGKLGNSEIRQEIVPLLDEIPCISCQGTRLNPLARNVRLNGETIASFCALSIEKALAFLETLQLPEKLGHLLEEVLRQLENRLKFLQEVGLGYLSLDRRAPSLSNGEAQRIRLARQLGAALNGILYVLDEPSIGLHPHDNELLNQSLHKLKDLGNTLLLVEHDPLTLRHADYIFDFGPGAGAHGGHIIAQGSYDKILKNPKSITGRYLSQKDAIPIPEKRQLGQKWVDIKNATIFNLKNLSCSFPIKTMTCLTGVSGSGKSTLVYEVIKPAVLEFLKQGASKRVATVEGCDAFDKLILIDQNPIGHTVRSDVGTYVDVLGALREFYASLALARTKGLQPKHFSYNHRKGMCSSCYGLGYKKVEMYFIPPVKVACDQCKGLRLNPVSLEITYEGMNFGQVLELTVDEARKIFALLPKPRRIFDTLISTGLGYLKLGQEMASLSGGEAQRMKLSRELSKRSTGKTLYLLDEPTTGLHFVDIQKLLELLHRLVHKGNTILIIEHNLDIIKNADYIIDLGPGAGDKGGKLVCQGIPEEIALNPGSYTGKYLKAVL